MVTVMLTETSVKLQ